MIMQQSQVTWQLSERHFFKRTQKDPILVKKDTGDPFSK